MSVDVNLLPTTLQVRADTEILKWVPAIKFTRSKLTSNASFRASDCLLR